jgi:hypothetical protein
MTPIERAAFARLRSFRRERGGLYAAYVAVYSRAYRARMAWLHNRGRHGRPAPGSICPRCPWCHAPAS